MTGINMVDFAVFGLLLVSAFIGLMRGFTREVLGVLSWVGALFVALYGLKWTTPMLSHYIRDPFVAAVVAGLLVFVITLFIFGIISRSLSGSVKGSVLGGLDRSLGFVFGLVRGGVVIVIGFFAASLLSNIEKWPPEIKSSKSFPYAADGASWLRGMIPEDSIKKFGIKTGLKENPEEASLDGVVSALSQPKAAGETKPTNDKEEPKKDAGYTEAHRTDMERLVKNNAKDET